MGDSPVHFHMLGPTTVIHYSPQPLFTANWAQHITCLAKTGLTVLFHLQMKRDHQFLGLKKKQLILNAKALHFVGIKFSSIWVHRMLEVTALSDNVLSHFILCVAERHLPSLL